MRRVYTKLEAAEAQLERALKLYLENSDYLSAITLAGAAEEPLGKMLEKAGEKHSLHIDSSAVVQTHLLLLNEDLQRKDAISTINVVRDWLKHFTDGKDGEFDAKEEAFRIIGRAVDNYIRLTGHESELMSRFRGLRGSDV